MGLHGPLRGMILLYSIVYSVSIVLYFIVLYNPIIKTTVDKRH
jgi:hypothetical protein